MSLVQPAKAETFEQAFVNARNAGNALPAGDIASIDTLCNTAYPYYQPHQGEPRISTEELRDSLRQKPFEPFRIILTDEANFDIRHPDLLWVGKRSAYVGLTGQPGQTLFERAVKVDLLHITHIVPLDAAASPPKNGPSTA